MQIRNNLFLPISLNKSCRALALTENLSLSAYLTKVLHKSAQNLTGFEEEQCKALLKKLPKEPLIQTSIVIDSEINELLKVKSKQLNLKLMNFYIVLIYNEVLNKEIDEYDLNVREVIS